MKEKSPKQGKERLWERGQEEKTQTWKEKRQCHDSQFGGAQNKRSMLIDILEELKVHFWVRSKGAIPISGTITKIDPTFYFRKCIL